MDNLLTQFLLDSDNFDINEVHTEMAGSKVNSNHFVLLPSPLVDVNLNRLGMKYSRSCVFGVAVFHA